MGKLSCLMMSSVALVIGGSMFGCGDAGQPEEPVGQERQGVETLPWWLVEQPTEWGCGQELQGRFVGLDSAHMYRFPGKVGYSYTFSFQATYPKAHGAAIAVYDSETLERVAYQPERWSNQVAVEYQAEKSVDYLVAVYSARWHTTGKYTLTAECERLGYCVEFETLDEEGTPYNNFYAINVATYEQGKEILAQVGNFWAEDIRVGSCADQGTMCPLYYSPICGDSPKAYTTYGNVCEFKAHVRQTAGVEGEWKGHWEKGECKDPAGTMCGGIAAFPCPEGYVCVLDGDYPDAGGTCQPGVCTYDGQQYAAGDSFPATDGCNTCNCMDNGSVGCTKIGCAPVCDPAVEYNRNYMFKPAECAVVRFTCPDNTSYFGNECGCGCEQAAECPEWINCMPPAGCDADQQQCPFSQVAW